MHVQFVRQYVEIVTTLSETTRQPLFQYPVIFERDDVGDFARLCLLKSSNPIRDENLLFCELRKLSIGLNSETDRRFQFLLIRGSAGPHRVAAPTSELPDTW